MKAICISCFDYYDNRMKSVIAYLESKGYETKYIIADFNHFSKSYYRVDRSNTEQIHVLSYKNNISIKRLLSHVFFSRGVEEILWKYKPSLVYCMIPPNSLAKHISNYKKKNTECKIIFDVYDMWPESMPAKKIETIEKIPFKFWANLRNNGLLNADLITTVSYSAKEIISKWVDGKEIPIEVIYPVIRDIRRPEYSFRTHGALSLCYLGNINYITNIDFMLNLIGKIRKHTEVRIHFIGGGMNLNDLTDKLDKIGVEVVRHGVVFDTIEKNKIFSMCDMGLNLPKKEVKSSMSLKSVEYLRAGLPFINTGVGDNWEMIENEMIGINVSSENTDTVAEKIANLSADDIGFMHKCCIATYEKLFIGQDMDKILKPVL